jgi:hypothetical protein
MAGLCKTNTKKSIILSALVSFVGCVKLRNESEIKDLRGGVTDLEIATCKKVEEVAEVPELTLEEMKEIMDTPITIGKKHYGKTFAEVCFVDGDEQYIDKWLRARLNGFPFKSEPDNRGNARSLVKFYDSFIRSFIIEFGKTHVGETFYKVCKEDPKFVEWCRKRIGKSTFHWKKTADIDNKKNATLLVEFLRVIDSEFIKSQSRKQQAQQQKEDQAVMKMQERLNKAKNKREELLKKRDQEKEKRDQEKTRYEEAAKKLKQAVADYKQKMDEIIVEDRKATNEVEDQK